MPIQPFFPEPVTVSGNVAEAKHKVRVGFVRRVVLGHFLSALLVFLSGWLVPPLIQFQVAAALFVLGLVVLSMQRRLLNGGGKDNVSSLLILVPTLFSLGQALFQTGSGGWPVVLLGSAVVGLALYATLCGNDFSYIGQFLICSFTTIGTAAVVFGLGKCDWIHAVIGSTAAVTYLFYFAYDLSMIVKRRRLGEEVAAVADLYRDLLNIVTYAPKVYFHWRKFRFI